MIALILQQTVSYGSGQDQLKNVTETKNSLLLAKTELSIEGSGNGSDDSEPTTYTVITEETTVNPVEISTTVEEEQPESNVETTTSAQLDTTECQLVGETKASNSNCNSFYLCAPTAQGLTFVELFCPRGTAFNSELRRCARDIAACKDDGPPCSKAGTLADAASNSTYILCVPTLFGGHFHKYRVRCASYEVFMSSLGTCFIDVAKMQAGNVNVFETRDLDIVKAELEEFKVREKALRKEAKRKEKLQQKLEKEMIKKAIKDAKERAKLECKSSEENEGFVCLQAGKFPSALGTNFYNDCVLKKGKLKVQTKICATGLHFDPESGICM